MAIDGWFSESKMVLSQSYVSINKPVKVMGTITNRNREPVLLPGVQDQLRSGTKFLVRKCTAPQKKTRSICCRFSGDPFKVDSWPQRSKTMPWSSPYVCCSLVPWRIPRGRLGCRLSSLLPQLPRWRPAMSFRLARHGSPIGVQPCNIQEHMIIYDHHLLVWWFYLGTDMDSFGNMMRNKSHSLYVHDFIYIYIYIYTLYTI